MNKIYMVDTGEYEQCIEAVFSTEEYAKKFIDIYKPSASICEMVLDEYVEQILNSQKLYYCFWYWNRAYPHANIELATDKEINKLFVEKSYDLTIHLYAYLYAESQEDAMNKFMQLIKQYTQQ